MTSPLRRAREEVAVNIAVTGFVSKLLPSRTKDLQERLQSLQVTLRRQEAGLASLRAAERKVAQNYGRNSIEVQKVQDRIREYQNRIKGTRSEIQGLNTTLRDHQGEMRKVLTQIRGWGIALGTSILLTGALAASVVVLSGEMRDLSIQAFRSNTSIQQLQATGNRFAAFFGDLTKAREAAVDLAEFNRQVNLIRFGRTSISLPDLALGLSGSGVRLNDLYNLDPDALHQKIVQALRAVEQKPLQFDALQKALPPSVFDAAFLELKAPAEIKRIAQASRELTVVTQAQTVPLGILQAQWGLMKSNVSATRNQILVGLAPALNTLFTLVNLVANGVGWLLRLNPTLTKTLGFVAVGILSLITLVSTYALILRTVAIAKLFFAGTNLFTVVTLKAVRGALIATRIAVIALSTAILSNPIGLALVAIGLGIAAFAGGLKVFNTETIGARKNLQDLNKEADNTQIPTFKEFNRQRLNPNQQVPFRAEPPGYVPIPRSSIGQGPPRREPTPVRIEQAPTRREPTPVRIEQAPPRIQSPTTTNPSRNEALRPINFNVPDSNSREAATSPTPIFQPPIQVAQNPPRREPSPVVQIGQSPPRREPSPVPLRQVTPQIEVMPTPVQIVQPPSERAPLPTRIGEAPPQREAAPTTPLRTPAFRPIISIAPTTESNRRENRLPPPPPASGGTNQGGGTPFDLSQRFTPNPITAFAPQTTSQTYDNRVINPTVENNYEINGVTNPDELADLLGTRTEESLTSFTSSRNSRGR